MQLIDYRSKNSAPEGKFTSEGLSKRT